MARGNEIELVEKTVEIIDSKFLEKTLEGLPVAVMVACKDIPQKTQKYLLGAMEPFVGTEGKSRSEMFFVEMEEERRALEHVPNKEEINKMSEVELEIATWNTLYFWLTDGVQLKQRLEDIPSNWGEYTKKMMDNVWENRNGDGEVVLFEAGRLTLTKKRLEEIHEQVGESKEYLDLLEKSREAAKMKKRDQLKLRALSDEKWEFERSEGYRKLMNEEYKLKKYIAGEFSQKEKQKTLAEELKYFGGVEFGYLFKAVVLDFILNSRTGMLWEKAEEAYLEVDEAVHAWSEEHDSDEKIEVKLQINDEKRCEILADRYWRLVFSSKTFWSGYSAGEREAVVNEIRLAARMLSSSLK